MVQVTKYAGQVNTCVLEHTGMEFPLPAALNNDGILHTFRVDTENTGVTNILHRRLKKEYVANFLLNPAPHWRWGHAREAADQHLQLPGLFVV